MAFSEFDFSPEQFSGRTKVFPLPNVTVFPHVMQPLHIFEPRYRTMLEEALSGDRLMAIAQLTPGWERDYDGRPPVYPVACLGRVAVSHRLASGSYNVLIAGLRRVRLLRELPPTKPFREAEVLVFEDRYPPQEPATTAGLLRALRDAFRRFLPETPQISEQVEELISADLTLGILTDIIGYMVDADVRQKQRLLSEFDVHRRAEMLLEYLDRAMLEPAGACRTGGFPPPFSSN